MDYELIRSPRRTLSIEITREGRTVVRAPLRCPEGEIESFVNSRRAWIERSAEKQRGRSALHPEPDDAARRRLISNARELLPARVEYYSKIMGLNPTGLTVTGARTRFGSCSPKDRLCFSWRLMQYPPEAVDYVVVHEIAHIRHKNHGKKFYALVASVLPDWQERRKKLRE